MKSIIPLCFLLLSSAVVGAQHPVSELEVELLHLFPGPTVAESAQQEKLRVLTLDIRDSEIVLDLYTSLSELDTIIERGKYKLLIKHDKDIMQVAIWKNNRRVKRIEREDNKAYALYKGIRSRVNSPLLRFGKGTTYIIQVQLADEVHPRVFRIRTRHPDTPKPIKEEQGARI